MPTFHRGPVRIHYEIRSTDSGGDPVLLIAPGGMNSTIDRWAVAPWNPVEQLPGRFTVIAMDQRNAGKSAAPVTASDGWSDHIGDQLALLDHLEIRRCHLVGMCIGGPYIVGLLRADSDRFGAAVLLQPVGVDDSNRADFYELFDAWADSLRSGGEVEVDDTVWDAYRTNMWSGDFVCTATPEDVGRIETPMLVFMGDDNYHPAWTSRQLVAAAPNATLVEEWKDPALLPDVDRRIREFLGAHPVGNR